MRHALHRSLCAGAPARTPSGATLVAPEAHAALGEVHFVESDPDVQVSFTSDAPVERVVGTSSVVDATTDDTPRRLADALRAALRRYEEAAER